jgi:hypothetical protein
MMLSIMAASNVR